MLNCCITGNRQALSTARFRRGSISASVIQNDSRPRPTKELIHNMECKETPIKLKQYWAYKEMLSHCWAMSVATDDCDQI